MGVPKVLADLRTRVGSIDRERPVVGILAFEAAATMSRLVSLYRSLDDDEVRRLRTDMRSQGVTYLTSKDQAFLLRLACAELVDELDRAAAAVARLGHKCSDPLLRGLDRLYADLKAGGICLFLRDGRAADQERFGVGATVKSVEKRIKRMERYVAATSRLYAEMQSLNELEASERRMQQQWRRHSGPIPVQKPGVTPAPPPRSARSPVAAPQVGRDRNHRVLMLQSNPDSPGKYSSGPLERLAAKGVTFLRNSAPILMAKGALDKPFESLGKVLEAAPNTVGGSGLALRYANVIVLAEKLLAIKSIEGHGAPEEEEAKEEAAAVAREELYQMMPSGMRGDCEGQAEGEERNMERQQRFHARPRALIPQTLHFSDREKTEAAIVEVLVGLSCMCWYEERGPEPLLTF
ncbi:hypothetical protein OPV22_006657 [Ensete ventricosum]|uniref:DUF3475 domain-containing protein n=1 Tax=Ensete ventricosum TaxID=4639 RepID=A0AAV8RS70_ENSVE|nr:hypothetical protein OPV22_006657 [Ensete ventricosum]